MTGPKMSREDFRRGVLAIVQPLYRGAFELAGELTAKLKDLIPFGSGEGFQHTMPFGLVSKPIQGTLCYFQNLLGNAQAPVVVAHLDLKRPTPSAPGETILYSLNADGSLTPVKVTLKNDGTYIVAADQLKLGSAAAGEPLVLGLVFQEMMVEILEKLNDLSTKVSTHTHIGNFGMATSAPIEAAQFVVLAQNFDDIKASPVEDGEVLSDKAFTEKGGD